MTRYIDADAFEADCRERYCTGCENYNGIKCKACWVDDMLGEIEYATTVSPNEVRGVGKWSESGYFDEMYGRSYICSVCGRDALGYTNWCPHCGAKMEVSEDA